MAGNPGEEVVHGLELETAVEPVHPWGAFDIHGGAHLASRERLGGSEVRCGHAPVGERDLDVENHGAHVRHHDKTNTYLPVGQSAPAEEVAENVPVTGHEENLDRTGPRSCAELCGTWGHKMQPAQHVQVEARKCHDGVIPPLLVRHE